MSDNIEHIKTFSNKQVISIVLFVIITTFTLTMIYAKFLQHNSELKSHKDKMEIELLQLHEKVDYVNDRLSRKIKE